jgi:DNA-directed RNA polymerase specialized sigma24 family protein
MSTETDSTSDALESVVNRFANMVRSVGHRHGLSDDDVDEVVQEVRIRLWRSRSTAENIFQLACVLCMPDRGLGGARCDLPPARPA